MNDSESEMSLFSDLEDLDMTLIPNSEAAD